MFFYKLGLIQTRPLSLVTLGSNKGRRDVPGSLMGEDTCIRLLVCSCYHWFVGCLMLRTITVSQDVLLSVCEKSGLHIYWRLNLKEATKMGNALNLISNNCSCFFFLYVK